jgi:hypothetical protein
MGNPSVLDDVFDSFVNGARLFKDREVLRHDYLPEKLPHREDQIRYWVQLSPQSLEIQGVLTFSSTERPELEKQLSLSTC